MPDARRPPLPQSLAEFARVTDRFRRPLAVTLVALVAASSPAAAFAEGDPTADANDGGPPQAVLPDQTPGVVRRPVDPAAPVEPQPDATGAGAASRAGSDAGARAPAPAPGRRARARAGPHLPCTGRRARTGPRACTGPRAGAGTPRRHPRRPRRSRPQRRPRRRSRPSSPPAPQRDTGVQAQPAPAPAPVAVAPQAPPAPAPVVAPQPREVVAVAESHADGLGAACDPGDTLWSIAQDRLGAGREPADGAA